MFPWNVNTLTNNAATVPDYPERIFVFTNSSVITISEQLPYLFRKLNPTFLTHQVSMVETPHSPFLWHDLQNGFISSCSSSVTLVLQLQYCSFSFRLLFQCFSIFMIYNNTPVLNEKFLTAFQLWKLVDMKPTRVKQSSISLRVPFHLDCRY